MSITAERDEVIDFTQNYLQPDPSAYITTGEGNKAAYIGVVAAQTATIQESHVAESGAILAEFATPDETISALRNGEVEAVMADKSFLAPIVAESNGGLKFIRPEAKGPNKKPKFIFFILILFFNYLSVLCLLFICMSIALIQTFYQLLSVSVAISLMVNIYYSTNHLA